MSENSIARRLHNRIHNKYVHTCMLLLNKRIDGVLLSCKTFRKENKVHVIFLFGVMNV